MGIASIQIPKRMDKGANSIGDQSFKGACREQGWGKGPLSGKYGPPSGTRSKNMSGNPYFPVMVSDTETSVPMVFVGDPVSSNQIKISFVVI